MKKYVDNVKDENAANQFDYRPIRQHLACDSLCRGWFVDDATRRVNRSILYTSDYTFFIGTGRNFICDCALGDPASSELGR